MDPILTAISTALAFYLGYLIKKSSLTNRIIPWLTFGVSFLNAIVNQLGLAGSSVAHAATLHPIVAFSLGGFGSILFSILWQTVVQTVAVTGAHSFVKNGVQGDTNHGEQ